MLLWNYHFLPFLFNSHSKITYDLLHHHIIHYFETFISHPYYSLYLTPLLYSCHWILLYSNYILINYYNYSNLHTLLLDSSASYNPNISPHEFTPPSQTSHSLSILYYKSIFIEEISHRNRPSEHPIILYYRLFLLKVYLYQI